MTIFDTPTSALIERQRVRNHLHREIETGQITDESQLVGRMLTLSLEDRTMLLKAVRANRGARAAGLFALDTKPCAELETIDFQ